MLKRFSILLKREAARFATSNYERMAVETWALSMGRDAAKLWCDA